MALLPLTLVMSGSIEEAQVLSRNTPLKLSTFTLHKCFRHINTHDKVLALGLL